MARKTVVAVLSISLMLTAGTVGWAQLPAVRTMPETPWYPLKIGNKWYYRVVTSPGPKKNDAGKEKNGDSSRKVVMEVKELLQIEFMKDGKAQKALAYRLVGVSEDRIDHKVKNAANRQLTEYISVTSDGVYRFAGSDKDITPPLKILKLPPGLGDSWECSVPLERGLATGTFTIQEDKITVQGVAYDTRRVSGEFTVGSQKMTADYWFAADVGIVKQKIKRGTFTVVLELEKFDPAK